jgi:organic radical activating enzyme
LERKISNIMIKQVINSQHPNTLRIEYMIGNTCNQKCWYCFPGSHEGEYRWTGDLESTTKNFFHILDYYKQYGKEKFEIHIVGGEPTLWPELGKFVKRIKEQYNSWISISTNGSRTVRWWEKYGQYFDDVLLSVHHEYADISHIKQVGDIVHKQGPVVNAMVLMDPFAWDKCVSLVKELKTSKHRWFINAAEVMHSTIDYTPSQIKYIKKSIKRFPNPLWLAKKIKYLKRNPKVVLDSGKIKTVSRNWFGLNKVTNFKGWQCNIGVDSIYIDKDGRITGACRTKLFENYNLNDPEFIDKFSPIIKPKICDIDGCYCQDEQLLDKIKIVS